MRTVAPARSDEWSAFYQFLWSHLPFIVGKDSTSSPRGRHYPRLICSFDTARGRYLRKRLVPPHMVGRYFVQRILGVRICSGLRTTVHAGIYRSAPSGILWATFIPCTLFEQHVYYFNKLIILSNCAGRVNMYFWHGISTRTTWQFSHGHILRMLR